MSTFDYARIDAYIKKTATLEIYNFIVVVGCGPLSERDSDSGVSGRARINHLFDQRLGRVSHVHGKCRCSLEKLMKVPNRAIGLMDHIDAEKSTK